MPRKVKTSFQKVAKPKKPPVKFKSSLVSTSDLAAFLHENNEDSRTTLELVEAFREECPHSWQEIASLHRDEIRLSYHSCKRCFVIVKRSGSSTVTMKNRLGGNAKTS